MSKKELAEKLGFDFEEVKDILSEETLKSFEQNYVVGGEDPTFGMPCLPPPPPPPSQAGWCHPFDSNCTPIQSPACIPIDWSC